MPRNGTGTYSLPEPPFVAGTVISSAAVNDDLSDIATALTGSLPRDGQAGMIGQFRAIDGSTVSPSISFNNENDTGFYRPAANQIGVVINGVQVSLFTTSGLFGAVPIGSILDYAGLAEPTLWAFCYGQAVSRTTYALLFTAIGTSFGSGDGSTTFNVPDLRGRTTFGSDNMGGVAANRLTTAFFGSDTTIIGDFGGADHRTLITANLPAYTPVGSISNGAITVTATTNAQAFVGGNTIANSSPGGAFNVSGGSVFPSASQATSTFIGSAQGGTQTAFAIVPPAIIINKMIFTGV